MDASWLFVVLGLGLGAGIAWWRIRAQKQSARDGSPARGPATRASSETGSLRRELSGYGARLQPVFDQAAHPEDLLQADAFLDGVRYLRGSGHGAADLVALLPSDNGVSACLILEALTQRTDSAPLVDDVLAQVRYLYPWPVYYVLRFLQRKAPSQPLVGAVVAQAQEWWADN